MNPVLRNGAGALTLSQAENRLVLRLIADPGDVQVQDLWQRWDAERQPLAAPTLLFFEVTNVLYRYQRLEEEGFRWKIKSSKT